MRQCAYAVGERSLGIYKAYYWLTAGLMVLMFVIAAWFVCLVAVNTTGAAWHAANRISLIALPCGSHRPCCQQLSSSQQNSGLAYWHPTWGGAWQSSLDPCGL